MAKEIVKPEQHAALTMPDDVRNELLQAQKESITTAQRLPQIVVMSSGVGLFQMDDTSETMSRFLGVVLNAHPRNVLWDKKFNDETRTEDQRLPACSSPDGKFGIPRRGFFHEALGRSAAGDESIDCSTCPYNKWGTGAKLITDKNPKGKAVTNQKSIFILTDFRQSPIELVLPPTSLPASDEYVTALLNRNQPVQAVVTEFSQVVKQKGTMKWGIVQFKNQRSLNAEEFQHAMQIRREYWDRITPLAAASLTGLAGIPIEQSEMGPNNDDPDLPF